MKTEITYSEFDLTNGICKSCGEKSNEILIEDGRCVDCIEADKFYIESMKSTTKH